MGEMTKARLKDFLLALDSYEDEASVISAWGAAWSDFFSVASAFSATANPSYVTDETTVIKIGVNSLLGSSDNSGSNVVVTCIPTGEAQNLVSQYDTANFIRTTELLGQSPVSTTLTDYEIALPAFVVESAALPTAQAAFEAALDGISDENAADNKLAAALTAWWADMQANPSNYFIGASAITPPSALSSLAADLQTAFDENNEDIESLGTITSDQALDRVAQALVDGNTGGIMEQPGGATPLQYTIG